MKIFIAGGSGLLGSGLVEAAVAAGHTVLAPRHRATSPLVLDQSGPSLDLTDAGAVESVLRTARPDAIVNCAALSQPAECEKNPGLSQSLNVDCPRHLASLGAALGARFIHLSSEQVFSGETDRPYRPDDPVSPRNVYGRHKVDSEQAVAQATGGRAVTVRAPLLLGNSVTRRRGHHEQVLAAWAAGQTPRMFIDEFRQPCTTTNLAAALLELCSRLDITGVVHWAGRDLVSRYELVARMRSRFGLREISAPIAPQTRQEVPAAASIRPRSLPLDISDLATRLSTQPETLDQALATLQPI